ncbi:MAG: RNA degradosome polyphosphate kinase, partial [Synergistales bacterium]|nr:RNA degradosome polyphosphate kinase [Synergistales bacterium]
MSKVEELAFKALKDSGQIDLDDPALYLNREINWLDFNYKVLEEAIDPSNPFLEQLKFLAIFFNNLDEFFMVRIAGLVRQYRSGVATTSADGFSPAKQLTMVRKNLLPMLSMAYDHWRNTLKPGLIEKDVNLVKFRDISDKNRGFLQKYFEEEIYPVLTPQAIDPGRPFPLISGLSLNFLVQLNDPYSGVKFARLKVPKNLSRFVFVPRNKEAKTYTNLGFSPNVRANDIVMIEDLIREHIGMLFPGLEVLTASTFRITRNTDLEIEEDEAHDLLEAVEDFVDKRDFGEVIRLEIRTGMPSDMYKFLMRRLHL